MRSVSERGEACNYLKFTFNPGVQYWDLLNLNSISYAVKFIGIIYIAFEIVSYVHPVTSDVGNL